MFCSIRNPTTGHIIDLSSLTNTKDQHNKWLVKGYGDDINKNFTIAICSSPFSSIPDNDKLDEDDFQIGATYDHDSVSIGKFNSNLTIFPNKRITLKYQDGDICPNNVDRKSTLLNFVCDRDINSKAQINYIGNINNCSYFFEVKTLYACPKADKTQEVSILPIFFSIITVFIIVDCFRRYINKRIIKGNNEFDNWQFLQEQSWWSKVKQFLFNGNRNNNNTFSNLQPIRLNNSNAFVRDMETQNDIIDSLDRDSNVSFPE